MILIHQMHIPVIIYHIGPKQIKVVNPEFKNIKKFRIQFQD